MMVGESQWKRPKAPPPRPWPDAGGGSSPPGDVPDARTDARRDARAQVEPLQRAFLRLRVDRVRIFRIDAALEAVTAADAVPLAGADAGAIHGARRALDRSVVLRAAADVVERPRVVGRDPVELRQRQVGELPPCLHVVVGLVETAVVADQHVPVIGRIPHHFVVIDVHRVQLQRPPGLAAVLAARDVGPGRVDRSRGSRDRRKSRCSSRGRRRGSSRPRARTHAPGARLRRPQPPEPRPASLVPRCRSARTWPAPAAAPRRRPRGRGRRRR